ncbi:MAG: alpha/beta hydrolase [Gammaproteobacteria bacterium]|nr:alpha/beta hydrolase [Gammaproteobacteria bacterium]
MHVVTNRRIDKKSGDLDIISKEPNEKGPNELRLLEITRRSGKYRVKLLDDRLPGRTSDRLRRILQLQPDDDIAQWRSFGVAYDFFTSALKDQKNILIFVHGYNNDLEDVLTTADKLEKLYDVKVVPFSWPANGGGPVTGAASYLSDKRDARVSTGAFDRFLEKLQQYHQMFTTLERGELWQKACGKHPDNHEAARAEYARLQARRCKVSINLLCHSMGNYLLKYATKPSGSMMRRAVFDNVCLVAADTNNRQHDEWVESIEARAGVYVVINKHDSALKWSRRKPGEQQLARLGHYLKELNAGNASYLNVTSAAHVGDDHSYFKDRPVRNNARLRRMFNSLFNGMEPESAMQYRADINAYELK